MKPDARSPAAMILPPNPVWRSYAGGRILRSFRGREGTPDDHFPEDWLASTVLARNGANSQGPEEGLSRIGGLVNGTSLLQSLEQQPRFWFGEREVGRGGTNVLWKLLDSSVRLQFQAHPDAPFARQYLNSNAGKTECWYIIVTRENACVYLGFQRPPTREAWAGMIREQRIEEMLACFDRIPVQPGDCFVVPAGTPHAIGAGVFMMELMEPTDWVVRCETVTAGVKLTPDQCFMGLDLERCLDIFDYLPCSLTQVRERFQQSPRVVQAVANYSEEELILPAHHEFFRLHRLRGRGTAHWEGGELLLLVVVKGKGTLCAGPGLVQLAQAGETWLLPGAGEAWDWTGGDGDWEFLIAKLPLSKPASES